MQPQINQPYEMIKLDKYTGKIEPPALLLMNRSFDLIGKISNFDNWKAAFAANGLDEITFDVHKYANGQLCPVWDDLIDLKIVDVSGFGRFEISVNYTDNTETVKSIHGFSLETELAQISLYEFHVNDEEAADMEITEYSKDNYDSQGNFIPTTFYREISKEDSPETADFKRKHSLLHRILADKAPHWSVGYVTPYIALDEESQPEESSKFQRTYTVDGETIYDFLTGAVAEESNVVFVFDTINRKINCYSLCDCIDQTTGEKVTGIGEDTMVFVSKNKLANEFNISSNKDNVKNCFRIEGGDDVITDMVRAVNMNGSNYIYQFADFQLNDMSEALRNKITGYQKMMSSKETQDMYYGENGIYTRLCNAYGDLLYYESSMMPNTDKVTDPGEAEDQYDKVFAKLNGSIVAVSSMNHYDSNLFVGVTRNVEAYAQVFLDSRFDLEIVAGTESYSYVKNSATGTWKGKIKIIQHTNEKNAYPTDIDSVSELIITINADELEFAKQKVYKALSKSAMADIDFNVAGMNETEMRNYFSQYALNRLESFAEGYNSCLSILAKMGQETASEVQKSLYRDYEKKRKIVESVKKKRQEQVDSVNSLIKEIKEEQKIFIYGGVYNNKSYDPHDFYAYLGSDVLYKELSSYRREDSYTNGNYISDGLSTRDCIAKAKELLEAATKEAKKACVLQRTVSTSLNNLFALPEFEPLYDKFALFNYIRVRTEDEILKLRIIGIEFSGDSTEKIEVTFSDQIESLDGTLSDLQSIIKQAGSMATSYPSTVLQAKQGSEANGEIADIYNNGLNAAKAMLKNNDSNEVTITSSGIVCKRMDDEGVYGEKQLRITGNIMAFTDDNWQSVRMAIGETMFQNPVTGDKKPEYGIIAENIVGKLIAGDKAFIGNKNNNVLITGDGITIKNGFIQSANYKTGKTGSMLDLSNGTFDYAGGRLTYKNNTLAVKGNITADELIATSKGKIANFNISENELYTDGATFGNDIGIYFGESGLNIKGKFKVDENGNLTANSGKIGGWDITGSSIIKIDNDGSLMQLNSNEKSLISQDKETGMNTKFYNSRIMFNNNDTSYLDMYVTKWKDRTENGLNFYSNKDNKYICFGHDKDTADIGYEPTLVLNYGLNPNNYTENVIVYGNQRITGKLYFNNNVYLSGRNNDGIHCIGKLYVGDNPGSSKKLNVDGGGYISGSFEIGNNLEVGNDLEVLGNLYVSGALENTFTSAPNLHIGNESGKIAKTSGSSKRFKTEIKPVSINDLIPDKLYDIDIVQYKFKTDYLSEEDQRYDKEVIGFIAEDIYEKYPIAADYTIDDDGNVIVNDWNFRYMIPAMLKLIQNQKKEIDIMKQKINFKT